MRARLQPNLRDFIIFCFVAIPLCASGGEQVGSRDFAAGDSNEGARSIWSFMRHECEFIGTGISEANLDSKEGNSYREAYVRAGYTLLAPLSRKEFLLLGFGYDAFFFDFDGIERFPDQLHQINLVLGGGVIVNDRLRVFVSTSPGIYSDLEDVSWEDVTGNAVAGAFWTWSETFQLVIGLRVAPYDRYPVLPLAGFKWQLSEQWSFNVIYPRSGIEYQPLEWLKLYAGAELRGAHYRVSEKFPGTTQDARPLAGEWLGYSHLSASVGASFQVAKHASLEIGAGYVLRREFDYPGLDYSEEVGDGAFLLQIATRMKF